MKPSDSPEREKDNEMLCDFFRVRDMCLGPLGPVVMKCQPKIVETMAELLGDLDGGC